MEWWSYLWKRNATAVVMLFWSKQADCITQSHSNLRIWKTWHAIVPASNKCRRDKEIQFQTPALDFRKLSLSFRALTAGPLPVSPFTVYDFIKPLPEHIRVGHWHKESFLKGSNFDRAHFSPDSGVFLADSTTDGSPQERWWHGGVRC